MMPSQFSDEEYEEAYERQHKEWDLNRSLLGVFIPVWTCEALALTLAYVIQHTLMVVP